MSSPGAKPTPSFGGARVLSLESRRETEMAALIRTYGGEPVVAPAMREVPIESNDEARDFVEALLRHEFDMVVLLTGVGTRRLLQIADAMGAHAGFVAALSEAKVVARGPKPVAVLRDLGVPVWLAAPEPNTWREIVSELDRRSAEQPMRDLRVAVQEYGVSNPDLLRELESRGARVTRVPVYAWALPEDTGPLHAAVASLLSGAIHVVLFTTSAQVAHLFQVAGDDTGALRTSLSGALLASIGPTTTEALREHGLEPDLEASHPKMGFLVREAAERSGALRHGKRVRS
jgi:uroporphyrinogen-III synthase